MTARTIGILMIAAGKFAVLALEVYDDEALLGYTTN